MSSDNYYVENNMFGIVGGSFNTVNNWIIVGRPMFESAGLANMISKAGLPLSNTKLGTSEGKISNGIYNLLLLEIVDRHFDSLFNTVAQAIKNGGNPIKVNITQLVNDCAHGVYFNNGTDENVVWQIANSMLSFICTVLGLNYDVKIARVINDYYYELYLRKA